MVVYRILKLMLLENYLYCYTKSLFPLTRGQGGNHNSPPLISSTPMEPLLNLQVILAFFDTGSRQQPLLNVGTASNHILSTLRIVMAYFTVASQTTGSIDTTVGLSTQMVISVVYSDRATSFVLPHPVNCPLTFHYLYRGVNAVYIAPIQAVARDYPATAVD